MKVIAILHSYEFKQGKSHNLYFAFTNEKFD